MDADLVVLLETLCPRVFTVIAPTATQRPYVTYQQIGGEVINPLANEVPGKRNALVQINVWSDRRLEATALMDSIEDAMRLATDFIARPQGAKFNDYDHDMKVYSAQQDFSIWY